MADGDTAMAVVFVYRGVIGRLWFQEVETDGGRDVVWSGGVTDEPGVTVAARHGDIFPDLTGEVMGLVPYRRNEGEEFDVFFIGVIVWIAIPENGLQRAEEDHRERQLLGFADL